MGELEIYQSDFEAQVRATVSVGAPPWLTWWSVRTQFLEETSAFYAREAQRWVQEDGLPDYLVKVRLSQHLVVLVRTVDS
jgi:hypothetical protein